MPKFPNEAIFAESKNKHESLIFRELRDHERKIADELASFSTKDNKFRNSKIIPRVLRAGALVWAFGLMTSQAEAQVKNPSAVESFEDVEDRPNISDKAKDKNTLVRFADQVDNGKRKVNEELGELDVESVVIDLIESTEDTRYAKVGKEWQRSGVRPVYIEASRCVIALTRTFPAGEGVPAGSTMSWTVDQYLNAISILQSVSPDGTMTQQIFVTPPPAMPNKAKDEYSEIKIDLGDKVISNLFFQKNATPFLNADASGVYPVYGRGFDSDDQLILAARARLAELGIEEAERLFGYAPETFVGSVLVDDDSESNAFSYQGRPDVVVLNSGLLFDEEINGDQLKKIGRHETFHGFDALYKISDTPEFQALYLALTADEHGDLLFSQVNEENFFPKGFGGHSEDNEKELFASFMNSLVLSDMTTWQKLIKTEHPVFLKKYYEALDVLRCALRDKTDIKVDAPIYKAIDERYDYLKAQLSVETKHKTL